jgi:hypothetical protein
MGEGSYHLPPKNASLPIMGEGRYKQETLGYLKNKVFLTVSGENIVVFTSAYLDQIALVHC